jgi:hypothetical protein
MLLVEDGPQARDMLLPRCPAVLQADEGRVAGGCCQQLLCA